MWHGTEYWMQTTLPGVLAPSTSSYTLRKMRNFLELSCWGWWQHCSTVSPGSNTDQITACCGRLFVFFFSLSKWMPGRYFEMSGVVRWSRTSKNRNEWSTYKRNSLNRSSVDAITVGVTHLVIKRSIFPRFQQVAVALMGLHRLIYLFTYLFICLLFT